MKRAIDILRSKPSQAIHTISSSTSILDAVRLMAERNVGALIVVEGNHIVGVVSERDYVRRLARLGSRAHEGEVADIMTSPVMYVKPSHSNEECMALMTDSRLRHLPVVEDGGRLLGVISIGDLVKDIISEQQYVIEQLEHYITGAPA
jgi:CBS domain-containing protein